MTLKTKQQKYFEQWIAQSPLNAEDIHYVDCVFADFAGLLRGKVVDFKNWCQGSEEVFFSNSVFLQTISGDYVEGDFEFTEPDIAFTPDLNTLKPSHQPNTLEVVYDEQTPTIAPRAILKKILNLFTQSNWDVVVALEAEFYLQKLSRFKRNKNRLDTGAFEYGMDELDQDRQVLNAINQALYSQGIAVCAITKEASPHQFELNFIHGDALSASDNMIFVKRTARHIARQYGYQASFVAKPSLEVSGNSMHIHQSLWDSTTKTNLFSQTDGKPSELFYHFIGGLQKYLPQVFLLCAPYLNSYRRFVSNFSAPTSLHWGFDNRTTGIRIPQSDTQNRRIENRLTGIDANPYLALAVQLACGYLGMVNQIKPSEALENKEAYGMGLDIYQIPKNFDESLALFEQGGEVCDLLGEDFCQTYLKVKKREYQEFFEPISLWEKKYLFQKI